MNINKIYEKALDFKPFWVLSLIVCFFLVPFWGVWMIVRKLLSQFQYTNYDYTKYKGQRGYNWDSLKQPFRPQIGQFSDEMSPPHICHL